MTSRTRTTLLGTVFSSATLFALASPAAAQTCTIAPAATPTSSVVCVTGETTNTTNAGVSPADDREYLVTTAGADATVDVNGDVTGYGLAITNSVGGANTLVITNDGTVQIDAGLAATAGGTAALDISATGATDVDYSGAGDVLNLGTTGDGLRIDTNGTGNITTNVGGDVTSAPGGNGIYALNSGTDGNISVTTATGTTVSANLVGVFAEVTNAASDGAISITNNATIGSLAGPGTLTHGVAANNFGLGGITITNTGDIGSSTDVLIGAGVLGQIINPLSTAGVSLTNSGDIVVADAGIAGYNSGTGTITINNTGALTSTMSAGIYAEQAGTGTTGLVSVTNSGAIDAATNGIQTSNAGLGGVTITNNGAITADAMGIRARGLNAAATGNILVQGSGTVDAGTVGIWAPTAGTGTTTVNYTGAINAGTLGVLATSTTGAASVTVNNVTAGDTGVQVVNTGTQSITANGAVTGTTTAGIHSDTTGNRTITVGTAGNVQGGAEAILLTNTGTATITNRGIVGTTGMLALNAAAAGATTFNNNAGATLNGNLTFGAGNDALVNAGTFNTEGTTDFGAGTDTFTNTGTFNLTGDATFVGLETTSLGGTTNLNGNTFTGSGTFTNTGTLNADGGSIQGFTALSNAGTLNLDAGTTTVAAAPFTNSGTINATSGDSTLTGQTSFTNTGLINMIDGAADDSLTIDSSFAGGTGSRLGVDVDFDVADMLIVTGAITGTTAVDANILGSGALIGGGVQVVDGQSTSTANAFVLGNVTGASGLVAYDIEQVGSDYFLTAGLTQAGFDPVLIGTMVPDLWYPSANEVNANLAVPYKGDGLGFWVQGYASRDKYGDDEFEQTVAGVDYTVDNEISMGRLGIQGGVDIGMGDTGRVGITGGFGTHRGKGATELDADGWNIGAYGAFGGVTGFHAEALVKHDRYDVKFREGPLDDEETDVRSTGIDGSVGYRMPMGGENASLDIFAGVSHVWNKIDDFEAYGLTYRYDDFDSTRGRAGARWNLGGDIQPYVQAAIHHEFSDNGSVELNDGVSNFALDADRRGTWGRLEAGVGGSPSRFPSFGAWVDLGDVRGIGARLGFRFGGSADAAPLPPVVAPAPAPEPAPATQTCYDGSVILATDTCPMPPAPPPPPVAPERG